MIDARCKLASDIIIISWRRKSCQFKYEQKKESKEEARKVVEEGRRGERREERLNVLPGMGAVKEESLCVLSAYE